jgi:TBC1 domain family member 8/9
MTNAFEYGDEMLQQTTSMTEKPQEASQIGTNQPYLNLATSVLVFFHAPIGMYSSDFRFRMVVLADELLESFFETDLASSFQFDPLPDTQAQQGKGGFLGGLLSTFVTDDSKKMFNKFSDEVGKTIGRHQVWRLLSHRWCLSHACSTQVIHRPSIGKAKALQEPKAWESLLSSSNKGVPRSTSTPSLRTSPSMTSLTTLTSELSVSSAKVPHMLQAVTAATQERQTFAIDEAKDDEEVDGDDAGAEDDAGVMDEVIVHFLVIVGLFSPRAVSGGCVPSGPRFRSHRGR